MTVETGKGRVMPPSTGRIATLAGRILAALQELQMLVGEEVDLVLDPATEQPVLLPQAQQEVWNDAQNFRRLFEQAPIGIALLSRDFRFVRTNARLSVITGYRADELVGLAVPDLVNCGAGEIPEAQQLMRECDLGFCEAEAAFHHKDGHSVWLRFWVGILEESIGREGNVLALVQDVTAMKRAEAELAAHQGRLEEVVRQRTEELAATNRRLMQEMEEHLEADEAVRTLNEDLETRVRERTAELEESSRQMEKMNSFFVGRELRMAELKAEIERLERENRELRGRR